MLQGLGIIPALLGFFTVAEIISWSNKKLSHPKVSLGDPREDSIRAGFSAVFRHRWLTLRSSIIGTLVGIVPGVGGTVAGFVAYGHAVQSSSNPEDFGKGDIRGLIAPEAAIDAKDGGSLLPAIALGLPGSEAGVFLVTVLLLHGLVPGTPMFTTQLPLTFTLIIALLFSNLLTSIVGVLLTPQLAKLSNLPFERIALPALVLSLVIIVQLNGQLFDLMTVIAFGIAGYFFKVYDWPRVPFVIAFVLGSFIERNLAITTRLIELDRIQPLQRPASIVIFLLILVSIFWMYRKTKHDQDSQVYSLVDIGMAVAFTAMCILFSAYAVIAGYSTITVIISMSALLIGIVITLLYSKSYVAAPQTTLTADASGLLDKALLKRIITSRQHTALILLIAFPFIVLLIGFFVSIALLVFCWLAMKVASVPKDKFYALLWGIACASISYYLLVEVWSVVLPTPWLWQLL